MSPIVEISPEQARNLTGWVLTNKVQAPHVVKTGENETAAIVFVNEEPLLVFHNKTSGVRTLACSRGHAEELQKAGIIKEFQGPQRKG